MDALAPIIPALVAEGNEDVKLIRLETIEWDKDILPPADEAWAEIRSADWQPWPNASTWGFTGQAELVVPFLQDLPARTRGRFSEICIDLNAPACPQQPEMVCEVDLYLRDEWIVTKTFRNFTQRHQFIISSQELFERDNVFQIISRVVAGHGAGPRYFVKLFYARKRRLLSRLAERSIWLFSTARSGSTWVSHDLLCCDGKARPMDEPGLGQMFAPLDANAERFYNLNCKTWYYPSGLDQEWKLSERKYISGLSPFERSFIFRDAENKIWNRQNWQLYLKLFRENSFEHVLNEWGLLDYERVVFKMPNESHAADVIMQAFPESFMIFLIRDGRDVMKSRFSRFASVDLAETTDPSVRMHAIVFYSHYWNFQIDIIASAFAAHRPDRKIMLSYEKLRQNPREYLHDFLSKIGMCLSDQQMIDLIHNTTLENMPSEQKGDDKPRQTGRVGEFAEFFSEPEIAVMDFIMGPNLKKYGYTLYTHVGPAPGA